MADKSIKQKKKSFLSRWGILLFTIDTCLLVLSVHASNSCFVAGTRTIEKHFGFSSTQTQFLLAADNITGLVALLIFGYLAGKFNKARFMSIMIFGLAIGNIISTIPYYKSAIVSDIMKYEDDTVPLHVTNVTIKSSINQLDIVCVQNSQNDNTSCLVADESNDNGKYMYDKNMFYIFLLAQMVKGLFYGTMLNLPYVYINENSVTDKATFFSGMYNNNNYYYLISNFLNFYVSLYSSYLRYTSTILIGDLLALRAL